MKTMDFICPVHGKFEVLLEHEQEPPIWCPIYRDGTRIPCGKRLKKVWSVPSVHYKGSGFYTTDKER